MPLILLLLGQLVQVQVELRCDQYCQCCCCLVCGLMLEAGLVLVFMPVQLIQLVQVQV